MKGLIPDIEGQGSLELTCIVCLVNQTTTKKQKWNAGKHLFKITQLWKQQNVEAATKVVR